MDHGATVVVVLTGLLSRCRRELVEPERTALLLLAAGCWRPGSLEVWKAGTSILPDNNSDCCMAMRMGNGDVLALLLPRSDGGFLDVREPLPRRGTVQRQCCYRAWRKYRVHHTVTMNL